MPYYNKYASNTDKYYGPGLYGPKGYKKTQQTEQQLPSLLPSRPPTISERYPEMFKGIQYPQGIENEEQFRNLYGDPETYLGRVDKIRRALNTLIEQAEGYKLTPQQYSQRVLGKQIGMPSYLDMQLYGPDMYRKVLSEVSAGRQASGLIPQRQPISPLPAASSPSSPVVDQEAQPALPQTAFNKESYVEGLWQARQSAIGDLIRRGLFGQYAPEETTIFKKELQPESGITLQEIISLLSKKAGEQ